MDTSPRHTRASARDPRVDGMPSAGGPAGLELGGPERWVLSQVRRRGVTGFVVQMTLFAVLASAVLVAAMMAVLYGPDDPTFLPGLVMGMVVPALVAPPVLVFSVRLTASLDRASHLLWRAAHTDPLTEVANRRAFFDELDGPLGSGAVELAIVDMDAFKALNDRHGHAEGDAALVHVARWLEGLAGSDGLVARMGGDEFAVVRPASERAERPDRARFDHDGLSYSVTLGWAMHRPGSPVDDALRAADRSLYAAKPSAASSDR